MEKCTTSTSENITWQHVRLIAEVKQEQKSSNINSEFDDVMRSSVMWWRCTNVFVCIMTVDGCVKMTVALPAFQCKWLCLTLLFSKFAQDCFLQFTTFYFKFEK